MCVVVFVQYMCEMLLQGLSMTLAILSASAFFRSKFSCWWQHASRYWLHCPYGHIGSLYGDNCVEIVGLSCMYTHRNSPNVAVYQTPELHLTSQEKLWLSEYMVWLIEWLNWHKPFLSYIFCLQFDLTEQLSEMCFVLRFFFLGSNWLITHLLYTHISVYKFGFDLHTYVTPWHLPDHLSLFLLWCQ